MPAIPRTQQYYPSVKLSELSDLYSMGQLNGQKTCIISFLPKTLRISEKLPFNNKYVLFIENTTSVDDIAWSHSLYLNGERINDNVFLTAFVSANGTEYNIIFPNNVVDDSDVPLFDKLRIVCTVRTGAETINLSVEHSFVKLLNVEDIGLLSETQSLAFAGNPDTANYVLNHLKDYLPNGLIKWNDDIIEIGESANDTLLKIVTAIVYHNILISPNNASGFSFFFDLRRFTEEGIRSFLNEDVPYEGNYKNGICQIPVHILSDVLINVDRAPDFMAIDAGAGNRIYNIIRDNDLMTFNDLEGEVLRTVPQKIQDSKLRIINDIPRFVELFNLTLFPKSAIKLTAILIKYLFECSKKNSCNECKNKSILWLYATLDSLKDHPDFLRNILTHYFREPSNKIETFDQKAIKTTSLVWSPAIYTILNVAPRIVKAYFAKKVVKKIGADYIFDFERIDSSTIRIDQNGTDQPTYDNILGRQLYIIIETLHCRGRELVCTVFPSNNYISKNGVMDALKLMVCDFTGNFIPTTNIISKVGDLTQLRINYSTSVSDPTDGELAKVGHLDRAIIKVALRPSTKAEFDEWASGSNYSPQTYLGLRGEVINFELKVKLSDGYMAFWGNGSTLKSKGEFLNANDEYARNNPPVFRVVNRIVYEIYHRDNLWTPLPIVDGNRRRIGEIDNLFIQNIPDGSPDISSRMVNFYYHDQIDNEHFIAECNFNKPRKRANGINVSNNSNPANVPLGFMADGPAPGGDAFWNYYYPNGDIISRDNPAAGGTDYGIKQYPLASPDDPNDVVELIRMPDNLNIAFDLNGIHGIQQNIIYSFTMTQRRFANPGCFAAFIGILAQLNYNNVQSTGMCFADATSFPSVSHPNGDSIDTVYLETQAKRRAIIAAFREWSFTQIISGTDPMHNGDGAEHNANHNSHLHSGNFDVTWVEDLI